MTGDVLGIRLCTKIHFKWTLRIFWS